MSTENAVSLEDLSLAEIKQLAEEEAAGVVVARDENGRFVSQKPEKAEQNEDTTEETETEEQVFRKEIDLGDGSGVQVFEAPTLEELVEKLATAQVNATKKIRELSSKIKEVQPKKEKEAPKEREFSNDEEYVLSQEMASKPTSAFKKMFKEIVGVDITDFRSTVDRMKAFEAAQAEQQAQSSVETLKERATASFLADHPEFVPNQTNGTRLIRATNLLINEARAEGKDPKEIDYGTLLLNAYNDLNSSGLLELKSEDEAQETTGTDKPRIEEPVKTVPAPKPVKRASSLTVRSTTRPAPKTGLTQEEIDSMPLPKLRELVERQSRA